MLREDNPIFDEFIKTAETVNEERIESTNVEAHHSVEEIMKEIERLVIYTDSSRDDKTIKEKEEFTDLDKRRKTAKGEWFGRDLLLRVLNHFQMYDVVQGTNHVLYIRVLQTLLNHCPVTWHFPQDAVSSLTEQAIRLYRFCIDCGGLPPAGFEKNEEMRLRLYSIRYLMRHCNVTPKIIQGEVFFDDNNEALLAKRFSVIISALGGAKVLRRLCMDMHKSYNPTLGRFLITRNKVMYQKKRKLKPRIPYNYLIQLSWKYFDNRILLLTYTGAERQYNELLKISSAYLEALHLQGHSVFEDIYLQYENVPYELARNMHFEKLAVPRQYKRSFVIRLLETMFGPLYEETECADKRYSFDEYMRVVKFVLRDNPNPYWFTKQEIMKATGLAGCTLSAIIEDTSWMADEVNVSFQIYTDGINTWRKPLACGKNGRLFFPGTPFAGFGFYEVIYDFLYRHYPNVNKKILGNALENFVRTLLAERGISCVYGKYRDAKGLPGRDCDAIVEGAKSVCYIEMKKIPLPETYWEEDDVAVLETLGKGMLYSQTQILAHRVYLKRNGHIELHRTDKKGEEVAYDFNPGDKRVYAISLCLQEYDCMTNQFLVRAFLESTLRVTYHSVDESREKLMEQLNKTAGQIQKYVAELYGNTGYSSREVFFDSSFLSLQQFWVILQTCEGTEDFLTAVGGLHTVYSGSGDVYKEVINQRKWKKKQSKS